jgi:hypothetical protein
MKNAIKKGAVLLTLVGVASVGSVLAPQAASAHSAYWSKSRSGCQYSGGMSALHNYAWTVKDSGGCAGHAWLYVWYSGGGVSDPVHASGSVSISTGTNGMTRAYHKSQSGESWGRSH